MIDTEQVVIRAAQLTDAPAIACLFRQWTAQFDEPSDSAGDYMLEYLASPCTRGLVADQTGRVVGLLSYTVRPSLYHASPVCLIEELVVDEGARDRGIGRLLMEALLRQARLEGYAEVSVAVMPDNLPALRLYRSAGLGGEALYLEMHL